MRWTHKILIRFQRITLTFQDLVLCPSKVIMFIYSLFTLVTPWHLFLIYHDCLRFIVTYTEEMVFCIATGMHMDIRQKLRKTKMR